MTIKDFYQSIGGDYEDILRRLPTDDFVLRFVKRFPADPTYAELTAAVQQGDISACFEAAHKLKGIAGNLAFTPLYQALIALTDQLRPQDAPPDAALLRQVEEGYRTVLRAIDSL